MALPTAEEGYEWVPVETATPAKSALPPAEDGYEWVPAGGPPAPKKKPGFLETVWDYASEIGRQTEAGLINLVKGQSSVRVAPTEQDPYDQYLDYAAKESKKFQEKHGGDEKLGLGFTKSDFTQAATSAPFSIVGMAASAPVALLSGPAAPAVGLSTSLGTIYRMDSAQIMHSYLSAINDAAIERDGKPLTKEEEQFYRNKFSADATKHGLWEAIPEAISDVTGLGMLTKPLKSVFGKHLATRMIGKLGTFYGMELGTETISQQGEQPIEVKAGLSEGPERSLLSARDWWTSAKEIAGPTVIQTSVMGLIGGGAHQYSARKKAIGLNEVADGGLHKTMPDKVLEATVLLGEDTVEARPWDKKLKSSVAVLNDELAIRKKSTTENATEVPESTAGADADVPPEPPAGGPPSRNPDALTPEFFQTVHSWMANGQDNEGNPFTVDEAAKMLDAYKRKPGADPASVQAFEGIIGKVATETPTQPLTETVAPSPVQDMPAIAPDIQALTTFRAMLAGNPNLATLDISEAKSVIATQHPHLIDELNKAIIEHKGSKLNDPTWTGTLTMPFETPEMDLSGIPRVTPVKQETVQPAVEAVAVETDKEFEEQMKGIKQYFAGLKEQGMPEYATGAIVDRMREIMTNEKVKENPFSGFRWDKTTVPIESLRKGNEMVWSDAFTHRGSMTKGPIVVDHRGEVIDGNNRLREAINRGDTEIEVYIAKPQGEDHGPTEVKASGVGGKRGPEKEVNSLTTKPDIQREISEISDEDLDAMLDIPEKKETAPPKKETDAKPSGETVNRRNLLEGRGAVLPTAKPGKALDDILDAVAKEGVEGAGEALKGLYELFGGSSLKSFPGAIDSETYAKAKPHLEAALDHFIQVGKGLHEFAATIVQQFGDAIRPYLKQFIKEKRDGDIEEQAAGAGYEKVINLDENTGKGEGGTRTRRKLTEQEKAEKEAARVALEEKKARKAAMGEFKNVGYVYDPEKLNQKIKDKPPKSAAKIILDEMVPGKLWMIEFPEGATPGVVRAKDQVQGYIRTFKEYLVESRDRLRYMSGKSIDDKIEYWLNFRNGNIDTLKEWASEYGKKIQPIIDTFNGQASITNAIGRLQDALLPGERFGDPGTGTFSQHHTDIISIEAKNVYGSYKELLGSKNQNFYSFITDSWHNLLADENDILLSEINLYKRGRNEHVVRAGLPDYRADVELKKTEDFQAPFEFKGVGFGEEGWINQEERNRVIPAAYDAFKDLAATIGAPDNGMSIGGELAVQFANLGHKAKGAAAAYFPSVQTINFTRDNGDGTMAHEWGHGLHDLAAEDAKKEINSLIQTLEYIYDFEAGTRLVDDLLAKDSMFLKRMVSSKKQQRIEAVKGELTSRFEDTVRQQTDYYSTARQMDTDYTARAQEMWARAFEAYIYDTLAGKNNYLVNDFVAAGRVGGKSGVGTRLVYPSGKERETFNATIKHFLDGLVWDKSGKPSLKDDYVTIEKSNELMLQIQLKFLLDQVEERYKAIWSSEPSKDGYFWYRYDDTSFGPMMQPDGYDGYDKGFTSEGQNGTGAIAYLTQLHPDAILDYKLSNIQYGGENPTYISKERGGINDSLQEDGTEALEETPSHPDRGSDEEGDVRSGDGTGSPAGVGGTRTPGKQRGATDSSEGDSAEGVHTTPAGNYRITDPTLNDPKSVPVRFGLNLSAVKVLNLLESENRFPTDAEKNIMAKYSGWGGMAELFSYSPADAWKGKSELIKAELTEAELDSAASSSTSSYYTPVVVGQYMWKLAQRLGFTNGVVLDPATGANGLFLGTMPADLAQGTALQGIEMDALSARIAEKLYGLASIEHKPFQDVKKPNNRFDLTITNVPFENITPTDLKHNKGGHKLHNYFINKMLNLTAPGALSIMITTSNTLDTAGAHLTEFAEKAQFVGAIRLPSGIYSATQVPTDILVFRKNIEGSKFVGIPAAEWTTTGIDESTGLTINNYFLSHPEMVAGKLEKITGRYGNESLRVVGEGDLQENLERIASAFPDKIVEREAVRDAKSIDDIISAPGTVKEGGLYINDKGEVCLKVEGEEEKLPIATNGEKHKAEVARGYVNILDQVRATLRAQKTETDDAVVKAEQTKLKKYYDQFVKKFGAVNDPKNAAVYIDATDSAWVIALEEYDPDTGKVTKTADIFTKNITGIASRPDRAETDHDALAMALDEFGYPNLEYMARLRNSDVESVAKGVADRIIENPESGFLETMDEYLSGNVKRKLLVAKDMAQSNPEYARNVSLLEAAEPPEIPQHRITARIGASWISPEHLTDYVKDRMALSRNLSTVFNFSPVSNEWTMTFKGRSSWKGEVKAETQRQISRAKQSVEATTVWGTQRMDFFKLMECALQGKRPQVTFTVDRKTYLDEVATQAAETKLQEIQADFGQWLFAETERADQAVKRFNDLINTSVPMKADGSHLTFPGKSMWMVTPKEKEALGLGGAMVFYPHQMNATWKYLKNGNLYLGHEVGTGKTVTMALAGMEAKRLRGKKKVLYVTLNDSTMGQAVQEIKNLYPMANVLPVRVSTNEQRKQRSLQKIALNDFDIAIMRQQDYDRIGLSPESERVFIEEEIQELREILEEAKANGARILERDIQEQLHALEEKLKAPSVYDEAKKKNLFFDDLGVDLLIVDEAHKYKNVPYATRLTRITGLNPAGSPTAKDFFRKTQYLNAQYPKHDAIILASGTALSNSIAEMYNIQRMLQPQEVKRQGVWSFDRWIANYGDMGSQMEWDGARGQYKVITTNRRIVNAGRLLATAYQNVDSVRADDTPVKRPVIRGGEPQRVKVAPNQYVEDYKRIVLERCAEIESDPKNAIFEGVPDNMLRIISNMSKVAIDQRLDHHYAGTEMQQDSKIAVASQIILRRWKEEAEHKGVQLVFADLGIPGKYSDKFKYKTEDEISKLSAEDLTIYNEEMFEHESASAGFNTYEGLKKELVKLGIPEKQVAFIHDADHSNKETKAANLRSLFKKINAGDIRVLIGSTSKAGTGVNIQGRVSDIHHLDIWWNFSAWEQRNGRGIRAGNLYAQEGMPGTYIWNYVTETTVDATRWDKVFAKGKVLNAVLGGDINLDVIEDISDETMSAKMMAAEASGDPLMATQATLLQQVQGLRFEQAAHLDVVRRSRMDLAAIPGRIEALEKNIKDYQRSRDIMDKVTAVKFIGDNRTLVLEKHGKEISEALEKAVKADAGSWTESKKSALLVFGTHNEAETSEKVDGKEKKVKKYAFTPLPAKADIVGKTADPYGRRLLISGDILSSDRNLADIKIGNDKKATVEVKANVSRTVTEYLSYLNHSEESSKNTIADLKGNEPKLRKVIDTPWAKVNELATKDKALRDIETQMAARGVSVGDPTTGISIDKYKSIVPMLEDIADKDEWSIFNGAVYPQNNPLMAISKPVDLNKFLKSGKIKLNIESRYNAPENLSVLEGGKPGTVATKPIAYTTIDNETRFWVPAGTSFVTVDPVQWSLLQRIFGKEGSWHYDNEGHGHDRYIVHVNEQGQRDAFIWAKHPNHTPQGVKDIAEQGTKLAQPSIAADHTPEATLEDVKEIFKGQEVVQPGGANSPIYVKTRGGQYLTIETVREISENEVDFQMSYGEKFDKNTMELAGSYGDGVARLVRGVGGRWTLAHESMHFLEDAGIIDSGDVAALKGHIKGLVRDGKYETANKKDIGGAEDRANFLADALTKDTTPKGLVGRIIARIREYIDRLVNAFVNRTAGGVARDVKSGAIFNKETKPSLVEGEGVQYSVQKIVNSAEKYVKTKISEAPGKEASSATVNTWIKDETDAIIQTVLSKLPGNLPHMTFLEKTLKSPEWFDHPVFNRIVRLFVRDRNEIYHEYMNYLHNIDDPFVEETTISEAGTKLKRKDLTWSQIARGQASKDYQDLLSVINEGDTSWVRNKKKDLKGQIKEFEDHIRKQGVSEDTIAVWKLHRESYDRALDMMTAQMRQMLEAIEEEAAFRGIDPADYSEMWTTLKGAIAQMETWKGFYAPRIRKPGNWVVQASRGPEGFKEHHREHRGSELAARRLAKQLEREGWDVKEPFERNKIPEEVYGDIKQANVAKAIENALEGMKKGAMGKGMSEATIKFNEELLQEVADMIRMRGYRSSMIHRKQGQGAVTGFIEDPMERHVLYINNVARGMAKAQVARAAINQLMGNYVNGKRIGGIDPARESRVYTAAQDYIEEQLRNLDQTDRVIGWAKSLATFKFLGFNARSALVNTTSMVTTAPPAIHEYVGKGKVGFMRINREIAKAGKDYALFMRKKEIGNVDEMRFLEEEKRLGWDDPQYTRDALGQINKIQNRAWALTMQGAMAMFGTTEKWNRGATMLAAYRIARKVGNNHEEAMELAKNASDKAHGIYGRATLPSVAWGTNPAAKLAQMLYVYGKFSHNYLQMLYDLGFKKHNFTALIYGMIAPIVIGGGAAIPFKDLVFWPLIGMVLTLSGAKDKDEDPEKWFWDWTRRQLGKGAEQTGRYGLFGAIGMDLSGSLSIGVGIPKDAWEWAGAIGGVAKEGKMALHQAGLGNYGRAAEHLLPTGISNFARARREAKQGLTTEKGKRVWDESGKPYMPTTAETLLRLGGFRSSKQAMTTERLYEGKDQATKYAERRQEIYERYRVYLAKPDGERDMKEHKQIREDVRNYNDNIKKHGLKGEGVSLITFESMRRQAQSMRHATKNEKRMMQ